MTVPIFKMKNTALHRLVLFVAVSFFIISPLHSQDNSIQLSFNKSNDSITAGNINFNILKIYNPSAKTINASLLFSGPEEWSIISMTSEQLQLNANDTLYVPIHISPSNNAIGGISYIISALLKTDDQTYMASTNVSVTASSKWDFSVYKNNLFFTETNPSTTLHIKLANRGNTNELVKLNYKVGKLISFRNNDTDYSEYINLAAHKDTLIYQTVAHQTKLSATDKQRYANNWKESSVVVSASTDKESKSTALQLQKLNSVFENQRNQSASPLNIDYQMYNLMARQPIRNSLRAYGSLLFKKNRELQYSAGVQSIYFGETTTKFDFTRQFQYSLAYNSKMNSIQLGYNVSNGSLHTLNGRGIVGSLRFARNASIKYSFIQNPYSDIVGQSAGVNFGLGPLALNTEIVHEKANRNNYQATSGGAGLGFTLFKSHSVNLQLLGSKVTHDLGTKDTSVLGLSYKLTYSIRYKDFNLRLNSMSSERNYIQNSGLQQTYLDSRLRVNDKIYFTLYGNRQYYATSRYPYSFYNQSNHNLTDYARLSMSFYTGKVIFQFGPNYSGSTREVFSGLANFKSEYITQQPGVWTSATVKLGGYRSITPNVSLNTVRFNFKTTDPSLENFTLNNNLSYSVGLNYFDANWRINAYYASGSTSDLYRSVQVDEKPTLSSSLQFRPMYENYFFDRKVRLSAYLNYAYYMPSGRENIAYNIKYDHFFKKGWNLSVSGFMYTNIRILDDERGRVSTKDVNVMVGVTKAFNIQQPRIKYHNLKAVFFNDMDGDRLKSENEPPVSNIVVGVEKSQLRRNEASAIPEIRLISDVNGQIAINNLPRDDYRLSFSPISNLEYLYFLNGSEQTYMNEKNNTLYIPLAESYKIKGRVIVKRDPNSTEGKIDLSGIRVTAKGTNGEVYSVLTDNFGAYVLSVPNADKYKVKVANVFGAYFRIDTDEMTVQFTQNKTLNVDFVFVEQKREIQFDNGNQFYNFNSIGNP